MNAVIIYDDILLASNAHGMLLRASERAVVTAQWLIKPWRIEMLLSPRTAPMALQDAAGADLIVLAVRDQAALPSPVFHWLESWAWRRTVRDAALAVFEGTNGDSLTAPSCPNLSHFARRHGLNFISNDLQTSPGDSLPLAEERG